MNQEKDASIRRFLKKVGISSQNEIEKAWRGDKKVKIKMILISKDLNLEYSIEGEIGP